MCDWEECTTGTIGLPNPNQSSAAKTSGFLHPSICRYAARAFLRERFLALEGEGRTWTGQPSRRGIALFSALIEFWRTTGGVLPLPAAVGQTDFRGLQKLSFNPNWICRDVVTVLRIAPALRFTFPFGCKAVRFAELGTPKFGWLKMLNISARKCSVFPSVKVNCLKREKSQFTSFGPISVFLPRFPIVPEGCNSNALGSNQCWGSPVTGLLNLPGTTFGRSCIEKSIVFKFPYGW